MRIVKYTLVTIYILFVIIITAFLFTFNKFSNSVIGYKTIIGNKEILDDYKPGDLLVVSNKNEINEGDKILFYDTASGKNSLNITEVVNIKSTNKNEKTYVIENNVFLSSEYVIGTKDETMRIPFIGYLYMFFTSKIGYLISVIVPIVIYLVYTLRKYKKL